MKQWYVKTSQGVAGPIESAQLKQLAVEGRINADTLVRPEDMVKYVRAGKVQGLFGAPVPHPPSTPHAASPPAVRQETLPLTVLTTMALATVVLVGLTAAGWFLFYPRSAVLHQDDVGLVIPEGARVSEVEEPAAGGGFDSEIWSPDEPRSPPQVDARQDASSDAQPDSKDDSKLRELQGSLTELSEIERQQMQVHLSDNGGGRRVALLPRTTGAYVAAGIGRGLGQAAGSAVDVRNLSALANEMGTRRLIEVRKTYWDLYPDGSGFEEVATLFAQELLKKDVAMAGQLGMIRMASSSSPFSRAIDMGDIFRALFDDVKRFDGGVAPGSVLAFQRWLTLSFPTAEEMNFSHVDAISEAFQEHADQYASYVVARDRYEYWKAGRESEFFPTLESFAAYLGQAGWALRPAGSGPARAMVLEDAVAWVKLLEQIFGAPALEQALSTLRDAPKRASGAIDDPTRLRMHPQGRHLGTALMELLGRTSDENYALAMLYPRYKQPRQELEALYSRHGREVVLEKARKIRDAPRRESKYRYVLASSAAADLGISKVIDHDAFYELLTLEELAAAADSATAWFESVPYQLGGITVGEDSRFQNYVAASQDTLLVLQPYSHEKNGWAMDRIEMLVIDRHSLQLIRSIDVTPKGHVLNRRFRQHDLFNTSTLHLDAEPSPIAFDGKTAVVGMPSFSSEAALAVGAAMMVDVTTGEVFPQLVGSANLKPHAQNPRGDHFGAAAAVDGEYLAISAPNFKRNVDDRYNEGRVLVYRRGGVKPLFAVSLPRKYFEDSFGNFGFGQMLELSGNHLVVGLKRGNQRPAALVYDLETRKLVAAIDMEGAEYHVQSLVAAGDRLAILASLQVFIYDLPTGDLLYHLKEPLAREKTVIGFDGKILAVRKADDDHQFPSLALYDVDAKQQVGYVPFQGRARKGNQSGNKEGKPIDFQRFEYFAGNGMLALPAFFPTSGNTMWYLDLTNLHN